MTSRWKAALIFNALLIVAAALRAGGIGLIRSVTYPENAGVPAGELTGGALLVRGVPYSDSLVGAELARIDSLCFSHGLLDVTVSVDTIQRDDGVEVRLDISAGERARIARVSVGQTGSLTVTEVKRIIGIEEGSYFEPVRIEGSMAALLSHYINSGFPYAQVWLTDFAYDVKTNTVDLSLSVVEGEEAVISRVQFDGLAKTDTAFALRTSRLRPGSLYREGDVRRAREYLRSAGVFETVDQPRIERTGGGAVDVVVPVREVARSNRFQGAFGFSRRDGEDYILNGSAELGLGNIAGRGRDVYVKWLNDGQRYSTIDLKATERFFLSAPVHLDVEVGQVIHDTLYTSHSAGLYLTYPLGPGNALLAGAAVDRNIPGFGDLKRSVRQRYRIGFSATKGSRLRVNTHVDGAYKRSYLTGDRTSREGQFLYRFEGQVELPVFGDNSVFVRLLSESVFSSRDVPQAELYPLGGATSLRGFRENQFRGERIAFLNLEYRIGGEGWLFLFDDVGTFYRSGEGWTVKNGLGFGLRSISPVGLVALSFGVGERISLEGTRIHISITESF